MNALDPRLLAAVTRDRLRLESELGRRRFYPFFRMAWPHIDPAFFLDNWHIRLLCEELELAAARVNRELVINIPPRSMKSSIIGVAFPAWVWTWHPSAKFITGSNESQLATRDAVACRRLVQSEWYQARWGPGSPTLPRGNPGIAIRPDQGEKTYYETTAGGHRFIATPGKNVTGHGADYILCLPPDQVVLTDRGHQPIGQVVQERLARQVLAFDHERGEARFQDILAFETHPARPLVEIETEDGQVLRCTEDHPVWVEGRGYVAAGAVEEGNVVLTCRAACID